MEAGPPGSGRLILSGHGLLLGFHHSIDRTFDQRFAALFGEPRPTKLQFFTQGTGFPKYFGSPPSNYRELCKLNQHYADIASSYSIQKVTEELLLGMARNVHQQTGLKRLCIAGGVGLNSVANSRVSMKASELEKHKRVLHPG